MQIRHVLLIFLLYSGAVAVGCAPSDSSSEGRTSSVRDSAGVRVAYNAIHAEQRSCEVGGEPVLTIGSREEDSGELLYQVSGAARLTDDRVAIVHGSTDEVRVYDATGSLVTSAGRSGDGPGEFNNPRGIFTQPNGEIWIGDMSPFRFNVFDRDLEFARTVSPHPPFVMQPMEQGLLDDGRSILGLWRLQPTPEFEPDSIRIYTHDSSGERIDTIGVFEYGSFGNVPTDMSPIWMGRVFEPRTRLAVAGDRIAIGYSGSPEIRLFDASMNFDGIIRWDPVRNRQVTRDDIDQYHDDIRARYADAEDQSTQSQDFMRQQISPERPVSDQFPAFNRMRFGRDARLWVEIYARPADSTNAWMVFEADGRYACTVSLPRNFDLYEAGANYLLGRERDPDTGIELVHTYDLQKSE